ncbi:MAG: Cof-type HAD-IIB family hydrolase [Treponemataceae bacterium]
MKLPQGKIAPKIIAIDLDDTLLKEDLSISEYTVDVIQKALKKEIYIVLCSGRTDNAILPFIRQLESAASPFGRYMISQNGSSIFDLHKRMPLYSRTVDPDVIVHAYKESSKRGISCECYDESTIYAPFMSKWIERDVLLSGLKLKIIADFETHLRKGQPKLVISGDPEELLKLQVQLKADFGDKAVVFTSKPYFLEIMPKETGKGEALKYLAETILSLPQETTMCFGDGMNDESMITYAHFSTAMSNGLDHIKNIARFVSEKSHNDDGVAHFIEKYCL